MAETTNLTASFNTYVVEPLSDCFKKAFQEKEIESDGDVENESLGSHLEIFHSEVEIAPIDNFENSGTNFIAEEPASEKLQVPDTGFVDEAKESIIFNSNEDTKGCYLKLIPDSGGTLIAKWSETPLPGAIAYFHPRKPVSAFKYENHGGVVELVRGCHERRNEHYYSGWMEFFKFAYEADGVLTINKSENEGEFYYMNEDNQVFKILPKLGVEVRNACVLAAVPHHKEIFKGVKTATIGNFEDFATTSNGASWKPMRKNN